MNEAWILSDTTGQANADTGPKRDSRVHQVARHEESYPDGSPKHVWHSRVARNGEYVLHGCETWHYQNGRKQYEVTYANGYRIGAETYGDDQGRRVWQREYDGDRFTWTHCWPNGQPRIQSHWRDFQAEGDVIHWDASGKVTWSGSFEDGGLVARK
jgi:antitoxin component YwqK of YwqJK toxin-antitoxin module